MTADSFDDFMREARATAARAVRVAPLIDAFDRMQALLTTDEQREAFLAVIKAYNELLGVPWVTVRPKDPDGG
jgi:hypothetical protein